MPTGKTVDALGAIASAAINGTNSTGVGGFALDPITWISNGVVTTPDDNKIWLFGDGALDVFPNIYNEVDTADGQSRLIMNNMTAASIINTTVPNL
tara:strand:- start:7100 stop:7387 length:288 start_codon:yes stop_codon:yes gene_type:complete